MLAAVPGKYYLGSCARLSMRKPAFPHCEPGPEESLKRTGIHIYSTKPNLSSPHPSKNLLKKVGKDHKNWSLLSLCLVGVSLTCGFVPADWLALPQRFHGTLRGQTKTELGGSLSLPRQVFLELILCNAIFISFTLSARNEL